ncbi:hypothetical protein B0H15DRAFT_803847 [Mycena belliarum]|uniref:Uncharacterized protein n=1 Tax=Mycena belliarum TaxID=1033014 RepID=A0AAD6TVA8_9AGAR|nr:hypothetical protein B0H15DRAFT_803847 [Mycena belliae]
MKGHSPRARHFGKRVATFKRQRVGSESGGRGPTHIARSGGLRCHKPLMFKESVNVHACGAVSPSLNLSLHVYVLQFSESRFPIPDSRFSIQSYALSADSRASTSAFGSTARAPPASHSRHAGACRRGDGDVGVENTTKLKLGMGWGTKRGMVGWGKEERRGCGEGGRELVRAEHGEQDRTATARAPNGQRRLQGANVHREDVNTGREREKGGTRMDAGRADVTSDKTRRIRRGGMQRRRLWTIRDARWSDQARFDDRANNASRQDERGARAREAARARGVLIRGRKIRGARGIGTLRAAMERGHGARDTSRSTPVNAMNEMHGGGASRNESCETRVIERDQPQASADEMGWGNGCETPRRRGDQDPRTVRNRENRRRTGTGRAGEQA